eukprot:scaffold62228_cov23-Tisochrysis_lutea.AAC.1
MGGACKRCSSLQAPACHQVVGRPESCQVETPQKLHHWFLDGWFGRCGQWGAVKGKADFGYAALVGIHIAWIAVQHYLAIVIIRAYIQDQACAELCAHAQTHMCWYAEFYKAPYILMYRAVQMYRAGRLALAYLVMCTCIRVGWVHAVADLNV